MKKELLFSLSLAAASLTASFNGAAADWQDTSNLTPEPPPEELTAAAAAAAAPGAAPAAQAPAPSAAPAVAAPVPAQVDVLPAPVSAPPEEINAPVAASAPAPRVSKASAFVLRPATLRSRPTSAGTGDPIAAETRVRLESSVRNADGTWWFVTATGIGGGWLLESELGDPQN